MARKIQPRNYSIKVIEIDAHFTENPYNWLTEQARNLGVEWLLAHAADGITWGRIFNGRLALSSEYLAEVSPGIHITTLQQLRLFGLKAELLVWRSNANWRGRILSDDGDHEGWCYDEAQFLWGDHLVKEHEGFTLVAEGQEGLHHAVPLVNIPFDSDDTQQERWHPLRLDVRQYLVRQQDGRLTETQGRLTGLRFEHRKESSDE